MIAERPDISFLRAESAGFITLKPVDPLRAGIDDWQTVVVPQIALCVMNELVDEIKGSVLGNPFEIKFEIVEKLAMTPSLTCSSMARALSRIVYHPRPVPSSS